MVSETNDANSLGSQSNEQQLPGKANENRTLCITVRKVWSIPHAVIVVLLLTSRAIRKKQT